MEVVENLLNCGANIETRSEVGIIQILYIPLFVDFSVICMYDVLIFFIRTEALRSSQQRV